MSQFPKVFYAVLISKDDPDIWLTNPTIAAGDFQLSQDGQAFTNLVNTPVVSPAGSTQVKFELTEAERSIEASQIIGVDKAGDEWRDIAFTPEDCCDPT